ncbi:MAG: membrane dipeptidase [Bacteroidetes bacterium]|nr:membrane dipeptidase [Bacteroidota bacterium]
MKFLFDAHLDLSMNALEWNRDFRQEISQIRSLEQGMTDLPDREKGVVSFPAMREGNIGLCVATLIARYVKPKNKLPGWNSPEQAWAQTQGQLAWYRAMEEGQHLIQIKTPHDLTQHLSRWEENAVKNPIGYVLSLEGADSIISMDHLHRMHGEGLRAIGPAHYGPGTYAFGTDSSGSIGVQGKALLKEISALQLILDATHLCDQSFWETMEVYEGPVWASHNNVRTWVPNERQFNDEQIKILLSRGAVIGMAFDAWMMLPNWKRGSTDPKSSGLNLETIVDHIDHICQLAGNSNHVMIGSDLDGGFGKEQCPYDLETIADLQKLDGILLKRGYKEEDIEKIFSKNGIHFLLKNLS